MLGSTPDWPFFGAGFRKSPSCSPRTRRSEEPEAFGLKYYPQFCGIPGRMIRGYPWDPGGDNCLGSEGVHTLCQALMEHPTLEVLDALGCWVVAFNCTPWWKMEVMLMNLPYPIQILHGRWLCRLCILCIFYCMFPQMGPRYVQSSCSLGNVCRLIGNVCGGVLPQLHPHRFSIPIW